MNLDTIRQEIDRLDNSILLALQRRLEYGRITLKFKKSIESSPRENAIIERLMQRERSLLSAGVIEKLYRAIFTESKRVQGEAQPLIAFQGEHGAHGEIACREWNDQLVPMPCGDYLEMFAGVENEVYDYGMVPVETSSGGMNGEVGAALLQSDLHIVGAIRLPISHSLLVVPGTNPSELRRVYSNRSALTECQGAVERLRLDPIRFADAASAARTLSEEWPEATAAIASELAAKYYNLEVVESAIEDRRSVKTRFVTVSKKPLETAGSKSSITFEVDNKSGALVDVIRLFADAGLNMTRIDSIPTEGENFAFFLDFEGCCGSPAVQEILDLVKEKTVSFRLLGCYDEKSL